MSAARLLAAIAALLLAAAAAHAQASPSPYTSATRYDAMNRVTGTISADPDLAGGSDYPFLAVRNSYDQAGRLIAVETGYLTSWQSESVAPSAWSGFTAERTLETQYDAMGRKLRDAVREGGPTGTIRTVTDYSYDTAGRPKCTAVRMNAANFTAQLDACTQGTGGQDRITQSFYDAADQRIQLREGVGTSDEGTEATWAHNLNGQIVTVIDGNGNRAALVYDGHGRQNCWMFPSTARPSAFNDTVQSTAEATQAAALATAGNLSNGTTSVTGHCSTGIYETYAVDPNGNRTSLRKRDGSTIAYSYDALNRVISKTPTQAAARIGTAQELTSAQTRSVHYGYDLRNLQLFARFDGTGASNEGVTSAYDGFGRLASSSTNLGGTARVLNYAYDPNGNRTRISHPDSSPAQPRYFDYGYDGINRPRGIKENGDNDIAGYHYCRPGISNCPSGQLFMLGYTGSGRAFLYDGIGRPNYMVLDMADGQTHGTIWTFGYNGASQLTSATRTNDAYAWTGHYAVQRAYSTNGRNQYSQTVSAGGTTTFGFDDNGNLTTETPPGPATVRSYVYDLENRLVGAPGSVVLTYDPLGRLYAVSSPSSDTRFLYDGDALVAEYNSSGALLRRYVHGNGVDLPLFWYEGSGVSTSNRRQLAADRQGSIISIADGYGNQTAVNRYDEYGIPATVNEGRFQYTGQIWLPELGLYHYKARVYSPTLGRFLQTDPIGYDGGTNLYAYVDDDPINQIDPDGTYPEVVERAFRVLAEVDPVTTEIVVNVMTIGGILLDAANGPSPDFGIGAVAAREPVRQFLRREARETARGMNNPVTRAALRNGQQAHRTLSERAKQSGWQSNPQGIRHQDGRSVRPDALTRRGRPVEFKPNTPSGIARGRQQMRRYEQATERRGRLVCYHPRTHQIVPCGS